MKTKHLILVSYFLITLVIKGFSQQNGMLDSSFNSTGIYTFDFGFHDILNDVKVQSDQKIVVTGVSLNTQFAGELKVLRFLPNGDRDSAFANNGVFSIVLTNETYGIESQVRSDGKIVVMGLASKVFGYLDMLLLRLNANGTLDSSFGTNGSVVADFSPRDDYGQAMTLQADGKILVSGSITDTVTFFSTPVVIRYNENGSIDSTFGTNGIASYPAIEGDNELTSIIIQDDKKIVAAGHYSNVLGGFNDFDIFLMRLDTNGVFDSSFGTGGVVKTSLNGGVDDCFGLSQDKNGDLVVCGFTTLPNLTLDMVLLKYNLSGTLVPTFGTGGVVTFNNSDEDVAYDIEIQSDNKIVLGGTSGISFLGPRPMALWRYQSNGTPDATFGNNGFVNTSIFPYQQDINAIAIQADDRIVAAGKTNNGTQLDLAVLRYYNDLTTSVNELNPAESLHLFPNPALASSTVILKSGDHFKANCQVEITDLSGKPIAVYTNLKSQNETLQIQLPSNIVSGFYFVSVSDAASKQVQKLIVH
jgi:uncharacterized delta-60 repeat protein